MTLRESAGLTVALFVLIGLGGFGLRKAISHPPTTRRGSRWFKPASVC